MSFDSAMPGSPSVSPNFLIGWGQTLQSCPLVSSIISLKPNSLNFATINHYVMSRIFFHVCSFVSSNVFCVSITSLCNHQLLPRWTAHWYVELSKSSSNILLEKKKQGRLERYRLFHHFQKKIDPECCEGGLNRLFIKQTCCCHILYPHYMYNIYITIFPHNGGLDPHLWCKHHLSNISPYMFDGESQINDCKFHRFRYVSPLKITPSYWDPGFPIFRFLNEKTIVFPYPQS